MSAGTDARQAAQDTGPAWGRLSGRLVLVNLAILAAPVATLAAALAANGGRANLQILITLGSLFSTFLVVCGISLMRLFTTRYRVTDERIEMRSGLFFRSHRSAPIERIRSVDLTANPVHRLFGLTTVRIGTGDQGSTAGRRLELEGIATADAAELRRRLVAARDAARGRQLPADQDGPICELDWSWLRYGPLTVWGVGGVFLVAGSVYRTLHEMHVDPLKLGVVKDVEARFGSVPLWFGILVALLIVVVFGTVGATAVYIENWSGYQLRREDGGMLLVRRGLLVTRSVSIEERRLRGVELVEAIPLRWAGGARTNAIASGLGDREDNRRRRALTPPAPRAQALRVAAEVLAQDPGARSGSATATGAGLMAGDGLTAHPRVALRRRTNRALTAVLLIAAVPLGLGLWLGPALLVTAGVTAVVLLPVAVALARDAYRALGHAVRGRYLVARSGTFARRTVALQRDGIIGWRVSRSVFQRRAGLLTLGATTAAGEGIYQVRDLPVGAGLLLAEEAVPGLLAPFVERVEGAAGVSVR
ncbi:PH domain-containing protein [Kitasatospora mediocidica]|uniref:PH domain-containing protein n=1 Tax=Kitasatospora mediocidica TaxID=58352 RepID=UPI00056C500B|nr:PH domain-containing protein [Kitasatospora mediocidica]